MVKIKSKQLSYKDSGVDIDAGNELVDRIWPSVKRTLRSEVLSHLGGFGAMFRVPTNYTEPVLVSGTDGVGTKLKLAFELNKHNTIGIDLVAMCVNDVLVQGAEPLFFLDYFACGKLDVNVATSVIEGIAVGCEMAGCSLIGGETAEMPEMYEENEYDLAGFCVGVVERENIITGRQIMAGDIILGLPSSGAHSNGYSLIRHIIANSEMKLSDEFGNDTLGDILLTPTRIYVRTILRLIKEVDVLGLAHITGGGITENIPRVLPKGVRARINRDAWEIPVLFKMLQSHGNVSTEEMFRVFNCGIGMVLIVSPSDLRKTLQILEKEGENVYEIGVVERQPINTPQIIIL